MTVPPEYIAQQMFYNNTHVLTVCRDWKESGAQYWRLLHGTKLEEGFGAFAATTRRDVLDFALKVISHKLAGQPMILAYEHGYRQFKWVDIPLYLNTGKLRNK